MISPRLETILSRLLDDPVYLVFWVHKDGDLCMDGDRRLTDQQSRSFAIEACQHGNVLRVFEVFANEDRVRDVTEEIFAEAGMARVEEYAA